VSSAGRHYGGKSQADRREARRERFLAAGLALIGGDGLSAATVRGICAQAGLTPRYFYEEFGSIDEVARQLFDREFDAGLTRVGLAVAAAGEGTDERVLAAVRAVFELFAEDPNRVALLLTESTGSGVLARRRQERMEDVIAVVAGFGRTTYGGPTPPPQDAAAAERADRAVRIAATFVAGGLTQAVDAWFRGAVPGERDALERDLAAQIVAVGDAAFAGLTRSVEPAVDGDPSLGSGD
jgi:AcrR family transcriptional regulator